MVCAKSLRTPTACLPVALSALVVLVAHGRELTITPCFSFHGNDAELDADGLPVTSAPTRRAERSFQDYKNIFRHYKLAEGCCGTSEVVLLLIYHAQQCGVDDIS